MSFRSSLLDKSLKDFCVSMCGGGGGSGACGVWQREMSKEVPFLYPFNL